MTTWMLGVLAFTALLGVSARAAEAAAAAAGRARRGVWVASLLAAVLVPAAALLAGGSIPVRILPAEAAPPEVMHLPIQATAPGDDIAAGTSPVADRRGVDRLVLAGWALLSLLVLAGYGHAWGRFRRARRGWRRAFLCDQPVLLARDTGPAVFGLRRASIVLPEWVESAPTAVQRMIVLHEAEHARARDHVLLALAPLALALLPWNLPLWWHARRLRLAVELDCDRRVLARGVAAHGYGRLLLDIAGGSPGLPAGAVALAEPRTFLERRILCMSTPTPRRPILRTTLLAAAAVALALGACQTVAPLTPREATPLPTSDVQGPPPPADAAAADAAVAGTDSALPDTDVAATDPTAAPPPPAAPAAPLLLAWYPVPAALSPAAGPPAAPTMPTAAPVSTADIDPPLLVVDGVILRPGTRLQDAGIAPDDILQIEVIKGAAAATLYGSRAEHGVILITTTRGAGSRPSADPPTPTPTPRIEIRPAPGDARAPDHAPGGAVAPLHVVDGVIVSQAVFSLISPDDIEVIEVLKGAAAERLYGARAAAGVIMVTTRR